MQAYLAWNKKHRQKLLRRSAKRKENIVDGAMDQSKVGGKEVRTESDGAERHMTENDFLLQKEELVEDGKEAKELKAGQDEGQKEMRVSMWLFIFFNSL